jgi:hypothetical protein
MTRVSEARVRFRWPRRRWLVVAAVVALVLVSARILDQPQRLDGYKVLDDHNVAVQTVSGPGTWTRLTSLTETSGAVTVGVTSWTLPLPGFGDDIVWVAVRLQAPLGTRSVIDASSGQALTLLK